MSMRKPLGDKVIGIELVLGPQWILLIIEIQEARVLTLCHTRAPVAKANIHTTFPAAFEFPYCFLPLPIAPTFDQLKAMVGMG